MLNKIRADIARAIYPKKRKFEGMGSPLRQSPSFGSIPSETSAASPILRDKARHLFANSSYVRAGVEALITGLIGSGITPAIDKPISAQWDKHNAQLDADGLTDGYGLQSNMVKAMLVDGEGLAVRYGSQWRQLPSEMLDSTKTNDGSPLIVNGVEFDPSGKRIAYWILPQNPAFSVSYKPSVRVLAQDVIHLFQPLGAGQVRGVSHLSPVMVRLGEIDQLEDAALVSAKISAMHAGFIRDMSATKGLPYDGQQDGSTLQAGLEPGTLVRLSAGEDITFNDPPSATGIQSFLESQLRAVSAGLGVPYHLLTNNVSDANYSSLRASLTAWAKRLEALQHTLIIPQLIKPIWTSFVAYESLKGGLAGDTETPEFYPPAALTADRLKDIQADALDVESGFASRKQIVASRGYSLETVDDGSSQNLPKNKQESKGVH